MSPCPHGTAGAVPAAVGVAVLLQEPLLCGLGVLLLPPVQCCCRSVPISPSLPLPLSWGMSPSPWGCPQCLPPYSQVPTVLPVLYLLLWGWLGGAALLREPLLCGLGLGVSLLPAPLYLLAMRGKGPRPPALLRACGTCRAAVG